MSMDPIEGTHRSRNDSVGCGIGTGWKLWDVVAAVEDEAGGFWQGRRCINVGNRLAWLLD
jgi:hypothetical protein